MTRFYVATFQWQTPRGMTMRSWDGTVTANSEQEAFTMVREFAVSQGTRPDSVTLFYYLGAPE